MKTIKDMPEHSRPREKLREKGASALTDEELVAAILADHRRNRPHARDVVAPARRPARDGNDRHPGIPQPLHGRQCGGRQQAVQRQGVVDVREDVADVFFKR